MEREIVEAAVEGDGAALAAVVDEFTPTVLGAAYGLCGDLQRAGDIAQEVFAIAAARIGELREPAALPGWLMALTRTAARRHRRVDPAVPPAPAGPGPEDLAVARDEARRVRRAVEALPGPQRLPVVLHYFAGLALADLAALCGLPLSTVKQRMRLARARLREEMDTMTDTIEAGVRPDPADDPSDVIRLYAALRAGDAERVGALLDRRPDLVDARDGWTAAESFTHRLGVARGDGTPLLRAVERGDAAMARLLLARGADPDAACSCEGAERPLWVAVAQHQTAIAGLLLAHGADPDAPAFTGAAPLDVARLRGYGDLVELLEAHGAVAAGGAAPSAGPPVPDRAPALATGIKAIDLWCPLPERGLAHLTPAFGVGAAALVSELSFRAALGGRPVVWTGFVPAPTDLGDVHHELAESDLLDRVRVALAPPAAPLPAQLAAFDAGIAGAGDDAVVVVFAETGRLHHIEERLGVLAARPGLTLVVAPLDGSVAPPARAGSPYRASIVFDTDRARRRRWPAVGPDSWSHVADPELVALAARARARAPEAFDRYLDQPFHVAAPVTGVPGEFVGPAGLRAGVAALAW
jgi:RNA polymerase sigma factor (sigma-70 family)